MTGPKYSMIADEIVPRISDGGRAQRPKTAEEQRQHLAGNFVDDHFLRVLDLPILRRAVRGPYSNDCDSNGK